MGDSGHNLGHTKLPRGYPLAWGCQTTSCGDSWTSALGCPRFCNFWVSPSSDDFCSGPYAQISTRVLCGLSPCGVWMTWIPCCCCFWRSAPSRSRRSPHWNASRSLISGLSSIPTCWTLPGFFLFLSASLLASPGNVGAGGDGVCAGGHSDPLLGVPRSPSCLV